MIESYIKAEDGMAVVYTPTGTWALGPVSGLTPKAQAELEREGILIVTPASPSDDTAKD